ncbi:MAG: Na+/H+ antiporter NhaA [Verrucomicrobia bacterium]|nr:Na+/H+ antiporter NhaA [Verrucomicrobiota bacterium]
MKTTTETFISRFLRLESAGGIILIFAAVLALIFANSPMQHYYALLLDSPIMIRIGTFEIAKPLLLWINDGLMAVFFFLVGLELKRELIEGELSKKRNIVLPGIGAIGGMVVPALIYTYYNSSDPTAMKGWAIPTATDIAFALGVLSLLGSRVPISIKIFLTSLAIFDDIGAILIIATFYTAKISLASLLVAACCIPVLAWLNKRNPDSIAIFIVVGVVMWVAMLKSGVHATLTGIILAMFIPMKSKSNPEYSPLKHIELDLHFVVAFFVLPLFAFGNAGISLVGIGVKEVLHSVPLGITLGLFVGKQVGIFGFCWMATKLKLTSLPIGMTWGSLYGTAALCGIGFTMSLFIGSLAFEDSGVNTLFDERLGIILGSMASGIVGYLVLRARLPRDITKNIDMH